MAKLSDCDATAVWGFLGIRSTREAIEPALNVAGRLLANSMHRSEVEAGVLKPWHD